MVQTRAWRNGAGAERDFPLDDVSDLIAEDGVFVWVDFVDPTAADLGRVEDELGLHALAVEDAVESGQRSKLDRYRDSLFLVAYDVRRGRSAVAAGPEDEVGDETPLVTHEVKAFITPNALVTMHGAGFDVDDVGRRWDENADLARHGVPWLVWGLLDVLTDHASETVEQIEDRIDELEDDLFDDSPRGQHVQRRAFALRKALGTLRRLTLPMKDVIGSLLRGDGEAVSEGIRPYFRDVADHATTVAESVDQLRDAVSSVLETNLNLASNRQNLVMKKVTSWAAIIAIPTAITGFFGQNVTFPGEGHWSGLVISLVLIAVTSTSLYGAFRRRDWL